MNMNEVFINESSLEGQYEDVEEFLEKNTEFLKCANWFRKHSEVWKIWKKSTLYDADITKDKKFYQLRGYKVNTDKSTNDLMRKMKITLSQIEEEPPFWDLEQIKQVGIYKVDNRDITGTSLAEAAARESFVVSFYNIFYLDCVLKIMNNDIEKNIYSIHTKKGLSQYLFERKLIDADSFVKMYFAGTRINFTKLDPEYGLNQLQKAEVKECINNFQRFAQAENWDKIYTDPTLVYKEYQPASDKNNWFRNTEYNEKHIDKFRCINPKRCFGYREGEIFYALRIERDHKISDYG